MAGLCRACGNVCVYILVFLVICTVFSTEDRFFYNTYSSVSHSHHFVEISLLDGIHHVQKRRATEQPTITTKTPSNEFLSVSEINNTRLPATVNISKDVNKIENTLPKMPPTMFSKDGLGKNLGENGIGIRRNGTIAPILLKSSVLHANDNEALGNITDDDDLDENLSYGKVDMTDDAFNRTLKQYNVTNYIEDSHLYYNSTTIIGPIAGQEYWIDFNVSNKAVINYMLSNSHRRAATIKLSFDFPFYGHLIRNVTIATGGFIYTGDFVHSWLAATQYVAPLMANFDTSLSNASFIKHIDNSTAFTVQWENVSLQDRPKDGQFTFQATLHKNGDIVFVYRDVPTAIKKIQETVHPVKIGLSDAYIMDNSETTVRRKTIYEYHRINFPKEKISNWTVIYLRALPTCLDSKDCRLCVNSSPNLKCYWCPTINKCSNGLDRYHQDWLVMGCDVRQIAGEASCDYRTTYSNDHSEDDDNSYAPGDNHVSKEDVLSGVIGPNMTSMTSKPTFKMGVSGVFAVLFLLALIIGFGMWIAYAYRNPHTTSGQMLIRYRPSQWRWRRGEARYTAATIHM